MTLSEFKAWFEGYTESLDGAPSEKQFARIKAQVAKIDGVTISPVVYRDVYWPRVQPYYDKMWYSSSNGLPPATQWQSAASAPRTDKIAATYTAAMMDGEPAVFDPRIALFVAGKADAALDAAA